MLSVCANRFALAGCVQLRVCGVRRLVRRRRRILFGPHRWHWRSFGQVLGSSDAVQRRRDAVLLLSAGTYLSYTAMTTLNRSGIDVDGADLWVGGPHRVGSRRQLAVITSVPNMRRTGVNCSMLDGRNQLPREGWPAEALSADRGGRGQADRQSQSALGSCRTLALTRTGEMRCEICCTTDGYTHEAGATPESRCHESVTSRYERA